MENIRETATCIAMMDRTIIQMTDHPDSVKYILSFNINCINILNATKKKIKK